MKFFILSTVKKTGGTYLLHQLASCLEDYGHEVFFDYSDSNRTKSIYGDFNVCESVDSSDYTFIVPEILALKAINIKNANVYIWWLSVDNFFRYKRNDIFVDYFKSFSSLFLRKRPFFVELRKFKHLAQSYYAYEFLSNKGVDSFILSDYLDEVFFEHDSYFDAVRNDIILYNPSKGKNITKLLISSFPNFSFLPLIGYTAEEVHSLMKSSKLYIDFGHHPGKDRMPREAVISGCCLITGLSGSAANTVDIPLPRFKLDPNDNEFLTKFDILCSSIFNDFETVSSEFNEYRSSILAEKTVFQTQVANIFNG